MTESARTPPEDVRPDFDAMVQRLLVPLCVVLAILYLTYVLVQSIVASEPHFSPLLRTWLPSAGIFLGLALWLQLRPAPAAWSHALLGFTSVIVLINSSLVVYYGGPVFTAVMGLVLVGYATLALSLRWTLLLVVAGLGSWSFVATRAAPDPDWAPMGIFLISAASISVFTQYLRLQAYRRLVESRHAAQRLAEQRVRADLINTAAHELATPLTPIMLQLFSLRQGKLEPAQERSLDMVEQNLQRLTLFVQNVTEYAGNVEDTAIARVETDVAALLSNVIDSFRAMARRQATELDSSLEEGLLIDGDPSRLRLVFGQLIDNAIKFTPKGGRVVVGLKGAGSHARIEVQDSGRGLSGQELAHLFQPFAAADHGTRTGAHLGLHVARRIVEAHRGRLTAHSEGRDKGTTMVVELPLRTPSPQTN